jgi:ketosteroid isomerase-like protein
MIDIVRTKFTNAATIALLLLAGPAFADSDPVPAELDAFWAGIADAAAAGDFDAMASAYHDDAVLVSEARGKSVPIAMALAGWKPGIEATRRGEMSASVEFRFTDRLNDQDTAHQTGIFRYEESRPGSEPSVVYIHFEALLIRKDGWKMLMEYQKQPASEAEWAAAGE